MSIRMYANPGSLSCHRTTPMIEPAALDALLPQTQCTQCGFDGCLPYAEAIVAGRAGINQCAPGGDDGIRRLSALTGLPYVPLNPAHGSHQPRVLAVIDEAACIGCTICIQKCPVDAIAGAAKLMHTVLADECTGCELCVAPCPVDCIALIPVPATHPAVTSPALAADVARRRHRARLARLQRLAQQRDAPPLVGSPEHKRRAIAAAQQRARARRNRESAT